jgi:hypothetical protein
MPGVTPKPLSKPDNYVPPSGLKHFLEQVVGIDGDDGGLARSIELQLASRMPEDFEIWGKGPRADMARLIGEVAARCFQWPNAIFVPDDPFALIIWNRRRGSDLLTLTPAVESRLGWDFPMGRWRNQLEHNLGEVVDALLDWQSQLPPPSIT